MVSYIRSNLFAIKTTFIFTVLSLSACASKYDQNANSISHCKYSYQNGYEKVTNHKQKYIIEGDTLSLNVINFECAHTAFYTSRSMYKLYGDWDESVRLENDRFKTYLIWKEKDLFLDGKKFTIITCGQETKYGTTSSFMILDKQGRDLLVNDSQLKSKFVEFFSKEIKKKEDKKTNTIFFQKYIKQFNPKYWRKYKKYPNVKIYIE